VTGEVSVIIPTHDRCASLIDTLRGLDRQSLPADRFEVIVGVDGSSDGTTEALSALAPRLPYRLRWAQIPAAGSGAARNAAARLASTDLLVFLDDDQEASTELLAVHVARQREAAALVQGNYPTAAVYAHGGVALLYDRTLRGALSRMAAGRRPYLLWGGNFSVPRVVWDRVGGFDESFPRSQDTDFGLRVAATGIRIVVEPRALSWHRYVCPYPAFPRQMFEEGRSVVRLAKKHGLPEQLFLDTRLRAADRVLIAAWRRQPSVMRALGRLAVLSLRTADRLPLPPVQVTAARTVRRFYRLGGMASVSGKGASLEATTQPA